MKLIYSDHAKKRMKQRGITELEVEHVIKYPTYTKKSFEGRKESVGKVRDKTIKIAYFEEENFINVVSVMYN